MAWEKGWHSGVKKEAEERADCTGVQTVRAGEDGPGVLSRLDPLRQSGIILDPSGAE